MNALIHAHSGLRWLVLIMLLVAIVNAFTNTNKPFQTSGKKTALIAMIIVHIQMLLGLILYFTSPKVVFSGESMGNDILRFFLVEHILIMIVATAFITAGYSRTKKLADEAKKYKSIRIFYLIGLILILAGIPWPFRELGAGWF